MLVGVLASSPTSTSLPPPPPAFLPCPLVATALQRVEVPQLPLLHALLLCHLLVLSPHHHHHHHRVSFPPPLLQPQPMLLPQPMATVAVLTTVPTSKPMAREASTMYRMSKHPAIETLPARRRFGSTSPRHLSKFHVSHHRFTSSAVSSISSAVLRPHACIQLNRFSTQYYRIIVKKKKNYRKEMTR